MRYERRETLEQLIMEWVKWSEWSEEVRTKVSSNPPKLRTPILHDSLILLYFQICAGQNSYGFTRFTPLGGPLKKGTKGVIFLVCVEKVAHLGGGDRCWFWMCVWPTFCGPAKKIGGGTFWYQFHFDENASCGDIWNLRIFHKHCSVPTNVPCTT